MTAALAGLAVLTGCSRLRRRLRPAAAGPRGGRRRRLRGHGLLPRRAERRTALPGDGRRRGRRRGLRGAPLGMERQGQALLVRKDVDLPDNTIADIRQVSLLGEKYVALAAPTQQAATGRLSEGDTIEPGRDRPQPRGRGGARCAVLPADRRRRRPDSAPSPARPTW
ncbi:hypothetical protein [Nocardioides convexus]|uniref:hypothetical protein n=1 Tax=Nocardioides convexus TaxID=2712224 RepID=UPI00241838FB|nr:hypothetical protein [Nocardioides convexus]